jgi:hypothetical protein
MSRSTVEIVVEVENESFDRSNGLRVSETDGRLVVLKVGGNSHSTQK